MWIVIQLHGRALCSLCNDTTCIKRMYFYITRVSTHHNIFKESNNQDNQNTRAEYFTLGAQKCERDKESKNLLGSSFVKKKKEREKATAMEWS